MLKNTCNYGQLKKNVFNINSLTEFLEIRGDVEREVLGPEAIQGHQQQRRIRTDERRQSKRYQTWLQNSESMHDRTHFR